MGGAQWGISPMFVFNRLTPLFASRESRPSVGAHETRELAPRFNSEKQ
jgi:hypothetical protein